MRIYPGAGTLGARIEDVDLARNPSDEHLAKILAALGEYGVLCFPGQSVDTERFAEVGRLFGDLAVNIANQFHEPGFPEVMILSNRVVDGYPIGPMTAEQKAIKPPVSQPIFRTHPITGWTVLYCNPGYAVRIDGLEEPDSEDVLAYLFAHQTRDEFLHAHSWSVGDILIWDNIGTIHRAIADYAPDEHRYMRRVQVQAAKAGP